MENKNQPAFPVNEEITDRVDAGTKIYTGLSKREYFAAMAMMGLIAGKLASPDITNSSPENVAHLSVQYAEALINELSTPQP